MTSDCSISRVSDKDSLAPSDLCKDPQRKPHPFYTRSTGSDNNHQPRSQWGPISIQPCETLHTRPWTLQFSLPSRLNDQDYSTSFVSRAYTWKQVYFCCSSAHSVYAGRIPFLPWLLGFFETSTLTCKIENVVYIFVRIYSSLIVSSYLLRQPRIKDVVLITITISLLPLCFSPMTHKHQSKWVRG